MAVIISEENETVEWFGKDDLDFTGIPMPNEDDQRNVPVLLDQPY